MMGPFERVPSLRVDETRQLAGKECTLIEAPLPKPDRMKRDRSDDIGRRHAREPRNGARESGEVARDRLPPPVLEFVYQRAGNSLELESIEGAWGGCIRFMSRLAARQHERARMNAQGQRTRGTQVARGRRERRAAGNTGIGKQERKESEPGGAQGRSGTTPSAERRSRRCQVGLPSGDPNRGELRVLLGDQVRSEERPRARWSALGETGGS